MSNRVDPSLLRELKEFGAVNVEACFNCGNCTAICPLAEDGYTFPRNMIRMVQMGLRKRLARSPDPWLCYYCGDCSQTCPREAEPGETMMALRRWLTAQYDWTGLSKVFYKSRAKTLGAVLLSMALVVVAFALFHGPIVTDHVSIDTFAPVEIVHLLDWLVGAGIGFLIMTQVLRMHNLFLRSGEGMKIPIRVYIQEAWKLPLHFATQKRWLSCSEGEENAVKSRWQWFAHLLLVAAYFSMFVMIVVFLPWFQSDEMRSIFHPQRVLGYLAAMLMLYSTGRALWGRIVRKQEIHRFSQASDWLLPGLLFGLAGTGMIVSLFKYLQMPIATYSAYVAHVAVMMSLYVTIGPLGKWAHIFYRPLAVYFQAVKEKAREVGQTSDLAAAPAD